MSNLLKLTPENYYTKEANMQYVSVSQYKEFNGTTGKMGCEAYAMAKLRGEVQILKHWRNKFREAHPSNPEANSIVRISRRCF